MLPVPTESPSRRVALREGEKTHRGGAVLAMLLLLTVALRLPGINRPLVGNFATKNAVYGMIARNWARGEAGFWQPTLDVIRGQRRAWHLVEVPVSAYVTGSLWRVFGGSLDVWGRATAICWSMLSVALMYRLVCLWHQRRVAVLAALVMAAAPVSVIYGQSFMLEPSVVALSLGAMLAVARWCATARWTPAAVAILLMTLLLLTKLYMLVLALPLLAMAAGDWNELGHGGGSPAGSPGRRVAFVLMGLVIAAVPALAWYAWVMSVSSPESSQADRMFFSLRDSLRSHAWPHPLLATPAFYGRVLWNLGTVALTPIGLLFALLAFCERRWRVHWAWLLMGGFLIVALPRKFDEMNYYFLVVLPPLALLVALGWDHLLRRWGASRQGLILTTVAFVLLGLRLAWRPAFVTPAEDRAVIAAAEAARRSNPAGTPVVTTHGSTIDLLYYCDQSGWALAPNDPRLGKQLVRCREHGARRWVVANAAAASRSPQCRFWMDRLPLLHAGDGFRIYDLEPVSAHQTAGSCAPAARDTAMANERHASRYFAKQNRDGGNAVRCTTVHAATTGLRGR